jgi:hypothetical protein
LKLRECNKPGLIHCPKTKGLVNAIMRFIKDLSTQGKLEEIKKQKKKLKNINARLTRPYKTRTTIDDSTYEAVVEELHLGSGLKCPNYRVGRRQL